MQSWIRMLIKKVRDFQIFMSANVLKLKRRYFCWTEVAMTMLTLNVELCFTLDIYTSQVNPC